MPSQAAYSDTLDRLAEMLRRKPMTAREIAEAFKCCKPIAYKRLQALRQRGDVVFEEMLPPDSRMLGGRMLKRSGPRSVAYGVR